MKSVEEMMDHETQTMGRPCRYKNGWSYEFNDQEGRKHLVWVLIYDVAPREIKGFVSRETRVATFIDGHPRTSDIV